MTIEENTAYYNLYGKNKYKGMEDEDDDFKVQPRNKARNIYEFRYKKKGEEYAIVVKTEGVKRGIICECLDGKRRSCYRSKLFDAYFKNLSRGDGVLIQVRDDEKGKLSMRFTPAHWNKLYAGGHLSRLEGFNRLSDEVVFHILKTNFDTHTPWFATLQLVNTVFRDIVQNLQQQPAPTPTPSTSPPTPTIPPS